jgi:hypothetical protein
LRPTLDDGAHTPVHHVIRFLLLCAVPAAANGAQRVVRGLTVLKGGAVVLWSGGPLAGIVQLKAGQAAV